MVKAMLLDKKEMLVIIKGFLDEFQKCCNEGNRPTPEEFNRFLSNNFHIWSNGEQESKNLSEYLARIENFQSRYSHCNITLYAEESICAENHCAVYYKVDLKGRDGLKHQKYMMAFVVVDHDKIASWKEVQHEKTSSR